MIAVQNVTQATFFMQINAYLQDSALTNISLTQSKVNALNVMINVIYHFYSLKIFNVKY